MRELELAHAMDNAPDSEALWKAWSLAAATVDALVANLHLSDEDVHKLDLEIQNLRINRRTS